MKTSTIIVSINRIVVGIVMIIASLQISYSQVASWKNNPYEHKVFVENKGQFDVVDNVINEFSTYRSVPQANSIKYWAISGGVDLYFKTNGLLYNYSEPAKLNEKEKEEYYRKKRKGNHNENEEEATLIKLVPKTLFIEWVNANPNVEIIADEKQDFYFTYGGFSVENNETVIANAYKRILYKNIYPNIDIEYVFPKDSIGIKYNIILNPGAKVSDIKMRYKNALGVQLLDNGNLKINTELGEIIDHAPVTFFPNTRSRIESAFRLNNNEVTFNLPFESNSSNTIVIDPWTTNPTYTGFNSAYDVNFDLKGNVYTYGSYNAYKIAKFNSSGALQWIFSTNIGDTFTNASGTRITYGDFAVDENSSSIYVTEGFNDNGGGARILKINPNGVQTATFNGNSNFQEMWRAEYNRCINKIVIAGGGHVATQAAIMDTTLASLSSMNVLSNSEAYHDMALLAVDNVANFAYMATSRSGSYASDDNVMIKCPIPGLIPINPTFGKKNTGHKFREVRSIIYINGFTPYSLLVPTNALNGMAVSPNWLYTYDGDTLKRWNKTTGAIVQKVDVYSGAPTIWGGGILVRWGGITVDECDNLYVGDGKTIKCYDSALTLMNTYNLPDTVYDLKMGNNYKLYASGKGYVTEINVPSNPISITYTNASGCGACDGSATVRTCGGGTNPGVSYSWNSTPAQATQTASNLCPGTYIVTVNASCVVSFKDTIVIQGTPAALPTTQNISICQGNTFTLPDGSIVSVGGTYKDTVLNGNGCDSIITTNLTIVPALTGSQNPVLCYGSNFTLPGGAVVNTSGTYKDTIQNGSGCDSIVTTNLVIDPLIASSQNPEICNGDSLALPGGSYVLIGGTYSDTLTAKNGCDSVITTTLVVNPTPLTNSAIAICPGSNYTLPGGGVVSSAGVYNDTLLTTKGCDSIIVTTLTLSNLITFAQNPVICQGATFTLPDGSAASTSGVYVDTLTTVVGGCDSVITTTLIVNPVLQTSQAPVICSDTTYALPGGGTATVTGIYVDTLSSVVTGCDSIITVNLTVNPMYSYADTIVICGNITYTLPGGTVVSTSGLYIDTLPTIRGCDSIIATNLTVNPVYLQNQIANIVCPGYTHVLPGGDTVSTAGTYTDTLTTQFGCDSIIVTIVTVNPAPIASFTANPTTGTPPLTVVFTNTSQNANSYQWYFGDGATSTLTNPTHVYSTPGTYNVILVAYMNGVYCPDTARATIIVLENFSVLIPNVFTPNGDGTNDVFFVNTEGVKALEGEIYDRWGLKMYEWHTVDGGWDGYTAAGLLATDGTYYYIIKATELSGKTHYFKGPFTLIK